jgi:hypothetical protein
MLSTTAAGQHIIKRIQAAQLCYDSEGNAWEDTVTGDIYGKTNAGRCFRAPGPYNDRLEFFNRSTGHFDSTQLQREGEEPTADTAVCVSNLVPDIYALFPELEAQDAQILALWNGELDGQPEPPSPAPQSPVIDGASPQEDESESDRDTVTGPPSPTSEEQLSPVPDDASPEGASPSA